MPFAVIDVRGLQCPMVILKVKHELKKLPPGEVLELVGNKSSIMKDLLVFLKNQEGHTLDFQQGGGQFRVYITKTK